VSLEFRVSDDLILHVFLSLCLVLKGVVTRFIGRCLPDQTTAKSRIRNPMSLEVKAKPLGLLNCILFYPTDDIRNLDNAELAGKLNSYTNEKVKQN